MADHEAARHPRALASGGGESLRRRFEDMAAIPTIRREGFYIVLLVVTALAGQLFASYDFNLLVLTIPNITKSLHLSSTQVGALVFFIYGGEFVITIFSGYAMDRFGRKLVWQFNLVGTAVFTGLTYFVANYTEPLFPHVWWSISVPHRGCRSGLVSGWGGWRRRWRVRRVAQVAGVAAG